MSALNAVELLALWDRAQAVPPTRRPLALLAPLTEIDGLGGLPVGVCDARLLRLRERLFGPQLEARVDCPQCRESLEFTLPVGALCPAEPAEPGDPTGGLRCAHAGWSAEFHAPRHRDLEAVAEAPDPGAAREALLERCLESLRAPDGSARTLAEAPAELVAAVVAGMAAADPAADLRVDLTCPSCQAGWTAPLDPPAIVWAEIGWAASRLLREVHELAAAYGWSESGILTLTPARRQAYLDLVRAGTA